MFINNQLMYCKHILLCLSLIYMVGCVKETDTNSCVVEIPVDSIEVVRPTITMLNNNRDILPIRIFPANATNKTITWESSNPDVVRVIAPEESMTDASRAVIIEAMSLGTATITASSGGLSSSCVVTVEPNVYITGYGSGGRILLWINGETIYTPYYLTSFGTSVFVHNSTIYVSGFGYNSYYRALLYKLTPTIDETIDYLLPDNNVSTQATAVFVNDTDEYVLVNESLFGTSSQNSVVMKNRVAQYTLTDSKNANSMVVVGNDTYVGGTRVDGLSEYATIWKNGVPTDLTDGTTLANVVAIYISDGHTFALVVEDYIYSVWRDNVNINYFSEPEYEVKSIFVLGNDIYVSGGKLNDELLLRVPTIWKNGIPTLLSEREGTAMQMAVYKEDIYVVGFESYPEVFGWRAMFWKSGVPSILFEYDSSQAWSIFIK